ncbi:MAG: orotidine 5'-phosphate decarboxylase [Pyrinomonadaceae bacterium]|nr:MAG: orotidine 5'-phosphate decarboxylase [Pyrinomonadaceae bacterium]
MREKIILALDVPTKEQAVEIIRSVKDFVAAFKIGLQLFTAAGSEFVRELTSSGLKIFLDLKFHDIPNTVAKAGVEVAKLGVWMFNVHALGGAEMMRRTVEEVTNFCESKNLEKPKILGVTVLTSADDETLKQIGIKHSTEDAVRNLAVLSAQCGLDGVVASPHEIKSIRDSVERNDFLIVTPGIRPSFATAEDQKRVMTPKEAISLGVDYIVIGRPVLQSLNPKAALEKILVEIQ